MHKFPVTIPTWSPSKQWHYTRFNDKQELLDFVEDLFWNPDTKLNRTPGEYFFDEVSFEFNKQAQNFTNTGVFNDAPEGSSDYANYWDTEKEKCVKGAIYHNDKGNTWYLPRFYYQWINFLHIYVKAKKKFDFPEIRDVQYHMSLYEFLAEMNCMHSTTFKARQKCSSYFHYCILYNRYIFDDGFVGKVGASLKSHLLNPNGSWKFLDQYHNFTNEHTAWACTNSPNQPLAWQQLVETRTPDGRRVKVGTKSSITGVTFEKDSTSGVGGAIDYFFHEEGGIAPRADETFIFLKSAMKEGGLTTGMFSIAGSVGKLDQCKPLKEFTDKPEANGFYSVRTNLIDDKGTIGKSGLFIPEHWGMPPYIDKYGNSLTEQALSFIKKEREKMKSELSHEKYQLEVSQHPINIAEGFAVRTLSVFNTRLINKQRQRIEDGEYPIRYYDLERLSNGEISARKTDVKPMPYPTPTEKDADKRGCICILEHPVKGAKHRTYLASVDPISQGKTDNSDSLACVYIYKRAIEVRNIKGDETDISIEGDKIVAWWTGRFDDPNDTNEQILKLIEYYNAYTTCEKNVAGFISYVQLKKKQYLLAHKEDMILDQEFNDRDQTYSAYGWYNTPKMWELFLNYGIDSIKEELIPEGDGQSVVYGVERIPDIWLLKEMQEYNDKGNFDRIIAYCALMAFVVKQNLVMGKITIDRKQDDLPNAKKINRNLVSQSPIFQNIGRGVGMSRSQSGIFRNIK